METLLNFYVYIQLQVSLDKVIYSRLLESCGKSAGNIWLYISLQKVISIVIKSVFDHSLFRQQKM